MTGDRACLRAGALLVLALAITTLAARVHAAAMATPPATPIRDVVDTYHGERVVDPYRWLEDWNDPEVQGWSAAQNAHARSYLDVLPAMEAVRARVAEILKHVTSDYRSVTWSGERLFAIKREPPRQQRFLVVMSSTDAKDERVLVDPNTIDPTGMTSIDWYRPSPDGRLVAVSLSVGGSEKGDLHVFDVASGEELAGEVIERVNGGTAGGDLAWRADGRAFYYTRYPRPGERPAEEMDFHLQLWFHELGTPHLADRLELGDDQLDRISEIHVESHAASGQVLATVQFGDSGRFAFWLREADGTWRRLADYDEGFVQAKLGHNGDLYFVSRADSPRGKIFRVTRGMKAAKEGDVLIPETEHSVQTSFWDAPSVVATETLLYVTYQTGGPSEIRAFTLDGEPAGGPRQPPVSTTENPTPLDGDAILFSSMSYLEPLAWYRFDPAGGTTRKTALASTSPVDFSECEVVREFTTSLDGTRVPVTVVRNKGIALDGSHPTLLYGYGGYGINESPYFSAVLKVWLEQGGVYAVATIRGGGEFGERWHREGMLTKKQNVFDDFAAAMQHLIDAGYTTPERLAITGGSNGGLLMGAMLTQHPDRFRAVVSTVGVYDMLRSELSPNGAFNIPEFGTVAHLEQYRALRAYSPYHNVEGDVAYPSTLFMTGANDPRVDPMHSRKMTARLQKATSADSPILLRTDSQSGHGVTALDKQIEHYTDRFTFLLHELGVTYRPAQPQ